MRGCFQLFEEEERARNEKLLLDWYDIRDLLLGHNGTKADVKRALLLAQQCSHPDAVWLSSTLAHHQECGSVFLEHAETDARASCFAWFFHGAKDLKLLQRSAEQGYAFAQAWMGHRTGASPEKFAWCEKSAEQGEREGIFVLAHCYHFGIGCRKNMEEARLLYLKCARLFHMSAIGRCAVWLSADDPLRWTLLGRVRAKGGSSVVFCKEFIVPAQKFFDEGDEGQFPVVFAIGRALHDHVDARLNFLFGEFQNDTKRRAFAKKCVDLFLMQTNAVRKTVDAWTAVAIRLGVMKDIRRLIASMIWALREQARF